MTMKYLYKSQYILAVLLLSFGISTNISAAITDILLTPSSIQENAPIGSTVGNLTTIDDTGLVIGTYSLVGGFGSNDNSSFTISGQEIQSNEVFNYESGTVSFSIRVHTEVGVESFEKVITITLTDVNEIPSISGISATPLSYTEGQAGLQVASTLAVADPENVLTSASVYFDSFLSGDSLYANSVLVPSNFDHVNKRLEISGTATPAVYQTVLRSVRYINLSENPGNTDRQVNFIVNDGTNTSIPVYRTIQVTPVNDPPVLGGVSASVMAYTEGTPGIIFAPAITVTDLDDVNLDSANVYFTSGYVSTEDSLYLVNPLFTITYKVSTGILRIKGSATIEQYQEALRNVRYTNTNKTNPTVLPNRVISIRVHDGNTFSNIVTRTISISALNDPPVASDAAILGTPTPVFYTRELLTADYTYTDPESNPENITSTGTSFRWHTATSATGTGIAVIGGAVSDTFTTRFADGGKWINMVVTPREQSGLWGDDDTSSWHYVNAAPVLQNFTIINKKHPGAFAVDETVKADYTYFDVELNAAGTNEYQWYSSQTGSWSDAQVISGATLDSFKITIAQNTRSIALQSYPHALSGTPRGERTRSPWFSVGTKPTAVISGNDTICRNSEVRRLTVTLTGTNPPWAIRYLKIGTTDTLNVSGIAASPYNLIVPDSGSYKLVKVSDQKYNFGIVSGTGIIKYFTIPTATLSNAQVGICPGDIGPFSYPIVLTGDEPWRVSILKVGADSFMISSIHVTPYNRPITLADTGTYTLLHVWDDNCMAAGSGSTKVVKKTAPSAIMSGDTAICAGGSAILHVELSGDGPWTFYYRRNTGSEIPVTVNMNLSHYIYSLSVVQAGTYTLTRVVDQVEEGCASGSAVVATHPIPTASFTEGTSACEHASNRLRLTLGGVAPWTVSYRYESDAPVSVSNIPTSPVNIPVSATGTYTLVSVSDKHCSVTTTGSHEIIPGPEVAISGFPDTLFSFSETAVPFNVEPMGGNFASSSNPGAIISINGVWNFSPSYAYITHGSPFWVVYSYQDPSTTCVGKDSTKLYILQFTAEINFESEQKERYCSNENPIELKGVNIKGNTGTFTISSPGTGLINAGQNVAYILPSVIKSGSRTVTYSVDIDGDIFTDQILLNFNHIIPDFSWDNECFDEQSLVTFTDESTSFPDNISDYQWNFYVGGDTITRYDAPSTSFTFNNRTTYAIELIASSVYMADTSYCYDTIRKELILKPTFAINGTPFIEDFQDNESSWFDFPEVKDGRNTWTFGRPEGPVFTTEASEKAWYTNMDNLNVAENSYVISPCFDFTGAKRPMIKMNIWRGFSTNPLELDGAVFQYSTDNGVNWEEVGSVNDGIYWFNSFQINGNPGGQRVGWDVTRDNNWMEARHKLDELIDLTNVRFRIAYGGIVQSGVSSNGIAFDDIWIGERSKKVLIEHFTNAGDPDSRIANENLNAIINTPENLNDIIDLQFHSDSPGNDTFNIINPEPPYSRDFYYGIPSIPYSIIDGGRGNQGAFLIDYSTNEVLVQNDLTLAALADNKFTIDMQTNLSGNSIDIDIDLKANTPVEQSSLTLHTVVIEELITGVTGDNGETSFESVVKDMLPGTGGTTFNQIWATGDIEEISLHYDYKNVFDEQQIRIVAFIQDYETGEVFQAVRMNPNVHVGIDPMESDKQTIKVFPNPARDIVNIEFPDLNTSAARIEVISFNGSLVYSSTVPAGESIVQLSTRNLSPGVYMLKVVGKNRLLGTEKLIVTGNN
jgi:hypothetical protein